MTGIRPRWQARQGATCAWVAEDYIMNSTKAPPISVFNIFNSVLVFQIFVAIYAPFWQHGAFPSPPRATPIESWTRSGLHPENSQDPGGNFGGFILVVGGLEYIGSHTTCELLKVGYNVIVIDDLSNSFIDVLETLQDLVDGLPNAQGSRRPALHFYKVDFRDEAKMQRILSRYVWRPLPDASYMIKGVIHFAAYKSVSESIRDPLRYYNNNNNNVSGLISFCQTLSNLKIKKMIFSSSATVYGSLADKGGRLSEEACTHEETHWQDSEGHDQTALAGCVGLTNPYGRSKWMCEAILSDLTFADPDWTIVALRYFNPVGCDEQGELGEDPVTAPTNLMPSIIKVMVGKMSHLNVYGTDWDTQDGTAVRDFIHVSDLARGHLAAFSANLPGFRAFNVGTGIGHSVKEVISAMEVASGMEIPVNELGRREGDVGTIQQRPWSSLDGSLPKVFSIAVTTCASLWELKMANLTEIKIRSSSLYS